MCCLLFVVCCLFVKSISKHTVPGRCPRFRRFSGSDSKDLLYFGDSGLLFRQDGVWAGAQGAKIFYTCLCFGHFYFSRLARFLNNRYENLHFCEIDKETLISGPRPEIQKIHRLRFQRFIVLLGFGTSFSAARVMGRRTGRENPLYVLMFRTFLFPPSS